MTRPLLLLTALLALASSAVAAPQRSAHECLTAGEVEFRSADGAELTGHLVGSGDAVVVLAHQSSGGLCDWAPYARRLARLGYTAFAFDFRGYGESSAPRDFRTHTRFENDIVAAVRELRRRGRTKIFVVGASLGGIAALAAGPRISPPLAGVVSVSSPARYSRMDGIAAGKRLRAPALFLAATADDTYAFDFSKDARALHRAAASRDKRLELVPGRLHGIELIGRSPRARSVLERWLAGR